MNSLGVHLIGVGDDQLILILLYLFLICKVVHKFYTLMHGMCTSVQNVLVTYTTY